ncbi:hypothetical protein ARMSODRAFT_1015792 [Armillaria solidipes]|uniref:Uncharacterized protein n=1 Tax=Armillaria solidipes TaxID=1076256 RepID=A0A2H3BTM8_9AGAR|nr:hypothetical protein ARMSODRAFT_1015792 [Armillaria solidipes]
MLLHQNAFDTENLAAHPDPEGVRMVYIALGPGAPDGHWWIVWKIPGSDTSSPSPAGYKCVEVFLHQTIYSLRVSFRRFDGYTVNKWALVALGELDLLHRNALVQVAQDDEINEQGNGNCQSCVKRIVELSVNRAGQRGGFDRERVKNAIRNAEALASALA